MWVTLISTSGPSQGPESLLVLSPRGSSKLTRSAQVLIFCTDDRDDPNSQCAGCAASSTQVACGAGGHVALPPPAQRDSPGRGRRLINSELVWSGARE